MNREPITDPARLLPARAASVAVQASSALPTTASCSKTGASTVTAASKAPNGPMTHHTRWLKIGVNWRMTLHHKPGVQWYNAVIDHDNQRITYWPFDAWRLKVTGDQTLVKVSKDGSDWQITASAQLTIHRGGAKIQSAHPNPVLKAGAGTVGIAA